MKIATSRLSLRSWTESDSEEFAKINSDPAVMQYFPSVYSRERSDEMMQLCNQEIVQFGFSFWALERKDTGALIGFTGLHNFNAELHFCPCVEIGWRLARSQWGKGFATEAARESLRLAFLDFKIESIYAFTTLENMRSRAVMSKIGMADTGDNFKHPNVTAESGLQDHCLYKIAKSDWLKSSC